MTKAPHFWSQGKYWVRGCHIGDNWFFIREPEGDVRIYHVPGPHFGEVPPECDVDFTIDRLIWPAVVAEVSYENDARSRAIARALHGIVEHA